MNNQPNRRAIVSIPSSYVLDLLTGQTFPTLMNQLPADVRLIGVWHDHRRNAFDLVVEHESFNQTVEGCELVRLDLTVMTRASAIQTLADRFFEEMEKDGIIGSEQTLTKGKRGSPQSYVDLGPATLGDYLDRAIGGRR